MKAIVYHSYGSPDVLQLEEVKKPAATDDQALVRIHATAVTPFDWHFLTGTPFVARFFAGLLKPKHEILGHDLAGRVEAVGENVTRFEPGDEVFGHSDTAGGYAEYVSVPEAQLSLKPASLSFEEAAAVPLSALTALTCLCGLGQIKAGQKVLINGASGGVGTLAVPIAKSFGAEVTGVCSTRNLELVRSIGADHVVDYTQEDFARNEGAYDLVFDAVAKRSFSDCKRALKPAGIYVTTAFSPALFLQGRWHSLTGSRKMVPLVPDLKGPGKEILDLYQAYLNAGKLKPVLDRSYTLSEVPEAFRYYGKGHARGRVVISI